MVELVTRAGSTRTRSSAARPDPCGGSTTSPSAATASRPPAANFDEVVAAVAEVRRRHGLDDVKLVLITNASLLDRRHVRRALEILDATAARSGPSSTPAPRSTTGRVARSQCPLRADPRQPAAGRPARPIVIQSLFMRIDGQPPPEAEQEAYCERLREIVAAGGQIKLVQVHTVARPPAESWVSPLCATHEVDALAERVRRARRACR